jgi:alkylation response protein AidB-like acyl-CoA dehydrogenase
MGESHNLWRTQLRRFIEREIMPYVDQWDEAGAIPRDLFLRAGAFGLLGAGYPVEYGGTGRGPDYDWHHGIVTSEELGRIGAGGITAALMIHGIGLPPVLAAGSDAMKTSLAPEVLAGRQQISLAITEPDAGSDVANLQTRAVRDGDVFTVNGSKLYITGGCTSHWFTTAVRTGGPGAGGISLLLIDANWPTQTQLHFVGLKLAVANLVVKIIGCDAPLFPFGICSKSGGLKRNTDAAPLCAVVGRKAEVFFEIAGVGRVLKDGVIVELRPMDVLGKHRGCQH